VALLAADVPRIAENGQVPESDAGRRAIRRLEEAVRLLGEATAGQERRGLSHDDADDITGTAATDDAIGFNPLPLLRSLAGRDRLLGSACRLAGS
jgi:hypothetical protein